ncbi:BZ3500_MvSof-1268-A1-R1_Chr2-3g05375 [Microbotryum saponariae]|uniref:BZ3500_MvSof-1268-A1-R1_Chr2-3g05375 protein n=1 Tax=Microbotryum saponariae TaxID=289078 RepID=A0A2X0L3W5_9BASI|nr:BZ3500_MvSof-1268-A1-R1_Chr2-3g05375 [Microbotryum saponariae]SDA01311.1 BZ3501_MvSof-1269-A2-R1_Chr2-2g05048 [Microbotryum saponariae]
MHPSTLLAAIILVHLSVVSGLPIASLPRETASIYSHAPNALPTRNPGQIAKADDVPRKYTTSPSTSSQPKSFDHVASVLASKLSAINHQLSRFPIVQPQSTAEGKGAKPMKSSTKRRMEKPTTTHKHKHHHKATSEKEAVHPRSSLRLRAVHSESECLAPEVIFPKLISASLICKQVR